MAELLSDAHLVSALDKLIENADEFLWLISPFIKLNARVRTRLSNLSKEKPKVRITVVFGKNEKDLSKSISQEDIEFLSGLNNIRIVYEPRLHAKFYASEDCSIVTSMNLYEFSQNNNIEIGLKLQSSPVLQQLGNNTTEQKLLGYFEQVIDNAIPIFEKGIVKKSEMFGMRTAYSHSEIILDKTATHFGVEKTPSVKHTERAAAPVVTSGYCIRTGKSIPFNPKRPMSLPAFESWSKFSNPSYKEKYCHYCGKPQPTSMIKPLCNGCVTRLA